MDKRLWTILGACGSLISLSSLVVFFINENYAIAIILALLVVAFIGLSVRSFLIPKLLYHKTEYMIDILDATGAKANCKKETLVEAKQKNINTIVDNNFAATGNIQFKATNIGKLHGPFIEGGTTVLKTILNTPLQIGAKKKKILTFEVNDGFKEPKESIAIQIDHFSKLFTMRIQFPADRPFKTVESSLHYDHKSMTLDEYLIFSHGNKEIFFEYFNVKCGQKIVIEWEW